MFDLYNLFYIPIYQGHIKISWVKEITSNESIRSSGLHYDCIQDDIYISYLLDTALGKEQC